MKKACPLGSYCIRQYTVVSTIMRQTTIVLALKRCQIVAIVAACPHRLIIHVDGQSAVAVFVLS